MRRPMSILGCCAKEKYKLGLMSYVWNPFNNNNKFFVYYITQDRSSAVGIATTLRAGRTGVQIPGGPDRLLCPLSLLLNGYSTPFPEVKRTGRESNHLPASSAEVKNEWSYTSSPPICLHGVHRENFTFLTLQRWCTHNTRCLQNTDPLPFVRLGSPHLYYYCTTEITIFTLISNPFPVLYYCSSTCSNEGSFPSRLIFIKTKSLMVSGQT
jgi:hypothetical protein